MSTTSTPNPYWEHVKEVFDYDKEDISVSTPEEVGSSMKPVLQFVDDYGTVK